MLARLLTFLAGAAVAATGASAQPSDQLTVPAEVGGALAEGDRRASDGVFLDDYALRLDPRQAVRLGVESAEFDTMIQVYSAADLNAPLAFDDDGGGGLNSQLTFRSDEGGNYVVRVTSFASAATGAYTLRAAIPPLVAGEPLLAGEPANLHWSVVDGALAGVTHADFGLRLGAGEEAIVLLRSDEFDSILSIFRADSGPDVELAGDDDTGNSFDAMVAFTASEAGEYVVRVGTLDGTSGNYQLRVAAPESAFRSARAGRTGSSN